MQFVVNKCSCNMRRGMHTCIASNERTYASDKRAGCMRCNSKHDLKSTRSISYHRGYEGDQTQKPDRCNLYVLCKIHVGYHYKYLQ